MVVINKSLKPASSAGDGFNFLQWKCDEMKSLEYEFRGYTGTSLDDIFSGVDTSNVQGFQNTFYNSSITKAPNINTAGATSINNIFSNCRSMAGSVRLTFPNCTSATSAFNGCGSLESLTIEDFSACTNATQLCYGCTKLKEVYITNTSKIRTLNNMFRDCSNLETLETFDLSGVTASAYSSNFLYGCKKLKNLKLTNIGVDLPIGSNQQNYEYGQDLTIESLIYCLNELIDRSSTGYANFQIGQLNVDKLSAVYVKTIPITAEMREQDPNIDKKKPMVVCESTDTGAMLATEYVVLKNWRLAI